MKEVFCLYFTDEDREKQGLGTLFSVSQVTEPGCLASVPSSCYHIAVLLDSYSSSLSSPSGKR